MLDPAGAFAEFDVTLVVVVICSIVSCTVAEVLAPLFASPPYTT
jgi:hypothetical protein